jgi:hypothetical protein
LRSNNSINIERLLAEPFSLNGGIETTFYILLSLKTPRGFEIYGQYFVGDHKESATALFAQFKGSDAIDDPLLLHIDLMETTDKFPIFLN